MGRDLKDMCHLPIPTLLIPSFLVTKFGEVKVALAQTELRNPCAGEAVVCSVMWTLLEGIPIPRIGFKKSCHILIKFTNICVVISVPKIYLVGKAGGEEAFNEWLAGKRKL